MAADLAEACSDLTQWLPRLGALTTQPDTQPGPGTRTAPSSWPPGNWTAAELLSVIIEDLHDAEQELRQAVTGTLTPRRPWRQTGAALKAIPRLGTAAPDLAGEHARRMNGHISAIAQMPAIDLEERPRLVRYPCKYCGFQMMLLLGRSGQITCTRQGSCFDDDGVHPVGEFVAYSDGSAAIFWNDRSIT